VLVCSNTRCRCEYPVIDGIPIIVADVRTYVARSILPLLARTDLSASMESLLGDCCGPGSPLDTQRQHLSTYSFDHYGDLDPEESGDTPVPPGSVLRLFREGLAAAAGSPVDGPVIDIGCSVGRTSFALAEAFDGIVLGIDLNFDMLRTASQVLHQGAVRYPRRRVGIVFDRREFPAAFKKSHNVDFWACDATAPPFTAGIFSLAASFNVLDCVNSPYDHLCSLGRILMPGGSAIISTPYDWSSSATPVESWLGGHSQRSESCGSSEAMLRDLLSGKHPQAIEGLKVVSEAEGIPWAVRVHDRSSMHYRVHMVVIRKG
jgi:SAM-dependent methyltransferase